MRNFSFGNSDCFSAEIEKDKCAGNNLVPTSHGFLTQQFCAHKEILYENMDYLWHNRYVALQSGVLMKMYRERQFLGLFTVHYHYRTENRDSSLQLGTKTNNQKSQHYCLICLMKKTWKQRMYNMHAAVQQDYHKLFIYMMSTVNPA